MALPTRTLTQFDLLETSYWDSQPQRAEGQAPNSPVVRVGQLEAGLGQFHLLLLDDKGQNLLVREVPVGLAAELKQLPDRHPQGPVGNQVTELLVTAQN